jgi:hypothetical protein
MPLRFENSSRATTVTLIKKKPATQRARMSRRCWTISAVNESTATKKIPERYSKIPKRFSLAAWIYNQPAVLLGSSSDIFSFFLYFLHIIDF